MAVPKRKVSKARRDTFCCMEAGCTGNDNL